MAVADNAKFANWQAEPVYTPTQILSEMITQKHYPAFCPSEWLHGPKMPVQVVKVAVGTEPDALAAIFSKLAFEWKTATAAQSSPVKIAMHPAYQKIIGMGKDALPLIFQELAERGGDWYWALAVITRDNPVRSEDAGDIQKMKETWLAYARERGYL